jgi:hypothetical protein
VIASPSETAVTLSGIPVERDGRADGDSFLTGTGANGATHQLITVIRSRDGALHRPFTTLELAALQSLVDPEGFL